MKTEDLELFRMVCFIVLMQHGEGLISKHPSYIKKKLKAVTESRFMWNLLDSESQKLVWEWAQDFSFPLNDCLVANSREFFK